MSDVNSRVAFFYSRVGKLVFRTSNECGCHACAVVYREGRIVRNKAHADYMYTAEELGSGIKYFATKEERDEFVSTLVVV